MTNAKLALLAGELLARLYPDARCALEWGGEPWKLVVMGRLSAQCRDERVNAVCVTLFSVYPDAASLAGADEDDVAQIIRPLGLFRTKAADIVGECRMITDNFGGRVPDTMEDLLTLPGVGRKVANLVLGDLYGRGGTVCDTHLMRICGRLGFYEEGLRDPAKIEKIMDACVAQPTRADFCHRMVQFGRDVCDARNPKCGTCTLGEICRHKGMQNAEWRRLP